MIRLYNDKDGILEQTCIDSDTSDTCTNGEQDKLVFGFDKLGNLISKTDNIGSESFTYDEFNRLKTETRFISGSSISLTYGYSSNGNLMQKGNDTLSYVPDALNNAGPHAVTGFKGTTLNYDNNGNMISSTNRGSDFIRTINYTGLNKAYHIENDNNRKSNYFIYDAGHSRVIRKDAQNNMRTKVTHYIGSVEMINSLDNSNTNSYKRYIGSLIIDMPTKISSPSIWKYSYQFKDHLGSSHSIITLDQFGSDFEDPTMMSFDAWGQRRWIDNFDVSDINLGDNQFDDVIDKTTRGYTGHEHLDETGIIHMNGRIYAPYLGRFLQADPFIQDPYNTQSLNRYTYVSNNPLSLNDPTGYFTVDAFMDNGGRQLIGVIISIVVPNAIIAGALSGAVNGGTKGAVIGAFSAAAFQGIGDHFDDISAASSTGKFLNTGLTAGQFAGKVALHGLVGGASSLGMGGKFGHGFASAGATQVSSPAIGKFGKQGVFSPKRVIIAAVVGGTVSSLTGGKFANGALTGAWSRAFNDEKLSIDQQKRLAIKSIAESLKELDGFNFEEEDAITAFINMSKHKAGIKAIRDVLNRNGPLSSGQIDFGLEIAIVLSVNNSAIKDLGSLAISGGRSKLMKTLRKAIEVGKNGIDLKDIANDIQERDYVGTASPIVGLNYATGGFKRLYYFNDNLQRRR